MDPACAEAMLRSAGFRITAHPEDEVFICQTTAGDPSQEFRWKELGAWSKR